MPNQTNLLLAANPFLNGPILPIAGALGAQMAVSASGVLSPHNTAVSTAFSGVFSTLQAVSTPIVQGQMYNFSSDTILVASDPNGNGAIPVPPGQTFNFGNIDLSQIYFAAKVNRGQMEVHLYWEA